MTRIFLGFLTALILISCSEKKNNKIQSSNPIVANQSFFYPYDTVPKIYQYRELKNGMYEQFHRVYGISRANGKHILVETFTQDGRHTETYDFLLESLLVHEHLVVGAMGDINRAFINGNQLFPLDSNEIQFNSQFAGISDAYVIGYDSRRKFNTITKRNILSKNIDCMKLNETIMVTNIDVKLKLKNESSNDIVRYYGKSIGLVEWHDVNDNQHYILEDIMTQNEWLKIISG
jgi:hypothetical protein